MKDEVQVPMKINIKEKSYSREKYGSFRLKEVSLLRKNTRFKFRGMIIELGVSYSCSLKKRGERVERTRRLFCKMAIAIQTK